MSPLAMPSPAPLTSKQRISALEVSLEAERAALSEERARVAALTKERDLLRASHERLRLELELLRRRIFAAKAERVDTRQLELDFATTLAALDRLGGTPPPPGDEGDPAAPEKKKKPTGRRDLRKMPLEEERVELPDVVFEKLVEEGKAKRIGFEESCKLAWKRGGLRRLVVARVKYSTLDKAGESMVETTPMPKECFSRSLAAPSLLAHVAIEKHCDGMPLFRVEDRLGRDGVRLDRGTMCRWLEDAGATLGATVIAAAREEAFRAAFCIATDATGVSILPPPKPDGGRQACKRGHYFVLIADKDFIFFEFTPTETSAVLEEMFRGYSGYVQADAKSVYDVLFRTPDTPTDAPDAPGEAAVREEVGCLAHCRRKFWEATCAKSEVAREGLARLGRIFALEDAWKADHHETIKRLRNQHLRPHMEAFFAWAELELEKVRDQRGLLRSALGYAVRQKDALLRVLDDGRLLLDNNRSERALRRIAIGRKAWLFIGSEDHAHSAGHLFSLIASARLHSLDPESYLRDLFRVLAHWPTDRYLELAPKYWAKTRARLDTAQLATEIGPLTVPPPEQEAPPN
jgi:transposase